MSTLLYYSTLVLCGAGVVSSLGYMWLNTFSTYSDVQVRNAGVVSTLWISIFFSLVFAALTCFLADPGEVGEAVERASFLFRIISFSWLSVALTSVVASVVRLFLKSSLKLESIKSLRKLVFISFFGFALGTALLWLVG